MGCPSSSMHYNTLFLTASWCLGLPGGRMPLFRICSYKSWCPFSMYILCFMFISQDKSHQVSTSCFLVFHFCSHDTEGLPSLYIFKCQVNNYSNNLPWSRCLIFIGYFINLHFKCYPAFQTPLIKPHHHISSQHFLYNSLPRTTHIHSHLTHLGSPFGGATFLPASRCYHHIDTR